MRIKQQTIAFYTLVRRELVRMFRIASQVFLPPVITTALYFLIFGNLVGNRIGPIDGVSYIQFIAPGLIMMSIITNAYGNVSTSLFSVRFQKSIEEILISPINFDDVMLVPTFILTPLTYLGGVFYSSHMLPPVWQTISHGNPILYMVSALRHAMIGQGEVNLTFSLTIIGLMLVSLIALNLIMLKKGIGMRD